MTKKESGEKANWKWSPDVRKWLTDDNADQRQFFAECRALFKSSKNLVSLLKNVLIDIKENLLETDNDFASSIESMTSIVEGMKKIATFNTGNATKEIDNHRVSLWKCRLSVEKLAIEKLISDLVVYILDSPSVESALRLAYLYNEILLVNLFGDFRTINVFGNTCPMLLHPLRKLSMTRILQILAQKRAEECSFHLISGLLDNYFRPYEQPTEGEILSTNPQVECPQENKPEEEKNTGNKLLVRENSVSSNTSVEIYRALTKHLDNKTKENEGVLSQPLESLWRNEEKRARVLLALSARAAPQLLGTNLIVPSKNSGNSRVKTSVRSKLTDYYQQLLWGEVGGYLEHILLWWNSDPLGTFPPPRCQNLRDYIVDLKSSALRPEASVTWVVTAPGPEHNPPGKGWIQVFGYLGLLPDFIPPLLVPSVNSLLDAMCCHLTSTSWDQLFRKTLVSAGNVKSDVYKGYGIEGSATGQLFVEMLADLIKLNNSCDDLCLDLEELPLVEQIPILHRLDHSVHMVRLWTSSRCRHLAVKWDLDEFYCTCHTDITKCLQTLSTLQLTDHGEIPVTTSLQVAVCIKMRAKLVSEIRENVDKLKRTANECITVLAKDCRTQSLAILHMCFPRPMYWRQNGPLPDCASDYVERYLDAVLRPVFVATQKMSPEIQQSSSSMIMRILCESWLEYVYLHRIKFSEWGAVQLLTDFGAIPTWLMERVQLPKELLNSLVSHEVLRRCEGVGRLLLRRRGESIRMTAPPLYRTTGEDSSADNMPAEMYVPNQEQWLDLRAPIKTNICCQL